MDKKIIGKEKKTSKKLQKYIDSITVVGGSDIPDDDGKIYYSKLDGSYITRVGLEDPFKFYLKFGFTQGVQSAHEDSDRVGTASLAFNPEEQKWYGWSHRAVFGFGIGSECKKGHSGFSSATKEDFAESMLKWYGDTDMDDSYKINATVKEIEQDGVLGVLVEYQYNNEVPNKNTRGMEDRDFTAYPEKWGKGEWVAKTLEDAKQMAIDFAQSVS
jgi:hypothetical protein|tara:strand:+ start:2889 stop:3533 length:645 start_codon:yes stop_codon:yes gene_type:complete